MERTEDLCIHANHSLYPVLIAGGILNAIACVPQPDGIREVWTRDIDFIRGIGIAQTNIETVFAMLILQHVLIDTNTEIGGLGIIVNMRHIVTMVGLAKSNFNDREPLVVKVDTQGTLILSVIRERHQASSHEIERDSKATEHWDRVFLKGEKLYLCRSCSCNDQQQQTNRPSSDRSKDEPSHSRKLQMDS